MTCENPRRVQSRLLWLLVIATSPGCAPEEEPPAERSVPGTPTEFVEPAEIDLGAVEGVEVELFHDLAPPFLVRDGSIVVPMRLAGEIRTFRPNGSFARSYGGLGDGPGEFRYLGAAWARGDTIEAWDMRLRRITRFLPDGVVETVQIRRGAGSRTILSSMVGVLSDGWLINSVISGGFSQRDRVAVYRFGMDGTQIGDEIVIESGMERYRTANYGGPTPLSPAVRFAFKGGAAGDQLYVAETLTPQIDVFDPAGTLDRTIHWDPEQIWGPGEALDRILHVVENGRDEPFRSRGGIDYSPDWIESAPPPEEVPVFSDFIVDQMGFVWIRSFKPERDAAALGGKVGDGRAGPGGEWMIFSPDGEEVGSLEVPDGFEPYQITADQVVGIYYDELGVEFVRVYSLSRH